MTYFDKRRRPIMAGDILKVWHFRDYTRTNRYVYGKVFASDRGLVVKCLGQLGERPLEDVHTYPLNAVDRKDLEIIDGHSIVEPNGGIRCWWERRRATAV